MSYVLSVCLSGSKISLALAGIVKNFQKNMMGLFFFGDFEELFALAGASETQEGHVVKCEG